MKNHRDVGNGWAAEVERRATIGLQGHRILVELRIKRGNAAAEPVGVELPLMHHEHSLIGDVQGHDTLTSPLRCSLALSLLLAVGVEHHAGSPRDCHASERPTGYEGVVVVRDLIEAVIRRQFGAHPAVVDLALAEYQG